MHQRKSKKILIYFFLLIIVSSINNTSFVNYKFDNIQNIKVRGLSEKENRIILEEIKSLNLKNIFLLNKNKISEIMISNSLIEKYSIIKQYPYTIHINIEKTKFFAKINHNGQTFFIGSNGKLTSQNIQDNNLPFIFGKPKIDEFLFFKNIIEQSKFSYQQIEHLYFFPSKRWDLKRKNNILLKLPKNVRSDILNNIYEFTKNLDSKKFNIVDARIDNQIILNE